MATSFPSHKSPITQMSTMCKDAVQSQEDITTTSATVLSFVNETDDEAAVVDIGFKVHAYKADGSSRGAILYGFSSGSQLGYVPAGVALDSSELPHNDPSKVWIKSDSGTITDAVIEVYKAIAV